MQLFLLCSFTSSKSAGLQHLTTQGTKPPPNPLTCKMRVPMVIWPCAMLEVRASARHLTTMEVEDMETCRQGQAAHWGRMRGRGQHSGGLGSTAGAGGAGSRMSRRATTTMMRETEELQNCGPSLTKAKHADDSGVSC